MPFTLAHPAAVLPLRRLGLTLALPPLVAGSMAPDLPYFVPTGAKVRDLTHSLLGAVTVDTLLGVAILAIGVLVAWPLAALLPPCWDVLAREWTGLAWPRSLRAVPGWYAGIAVGALTHVSWDAFTHPNGWVVERWAALRVEAGPMHVYTWLQDGCSVLGIAVVAYVLWQAAGRLDPGPVNPGAGGSRRLVAVLVLVGAVGGAVVKTAADANPLNRRFEVVTGFGGGAVLALLVYALVVQALGRRRQPN